MSITHINEHSTAVPEAFYPRPEGRTEPLVAVPSLRPERVEDHRKRLGGALEEIRDMGNQLDSLKSVSADQLSTIRELHTHIDYLERRIEKLEADLGAYTRMAVSLAQQQKAIATLCEEGRRLAAAAAVETDEPSDEA